MPMKNFLKIVLASFLGFVCFLVFLIVLFVVLLAESNKNDIDIERNSILKITFDKRLTERSSDNPLKNIGWMDFENSRSLGLNELIQGIRFAKKDKNISGIYLNVSEIPTGWASVEALRNALLDFKKSNKPIIVYSDIYSHKAYYLASVANKIYLNPEGYLEFRGLSTQYMFFKKALQKLGVEVQVIRVGTFKSAVEPFINEKMSEASKLQTSFLLKSIYNQFISGISKERNITTSTLQQIAEKLAIREPKNALAAHLVDGLKYEDEVIDELCTISQTQKQDDLPVLDIVDYIDKKASEPSKYIKNRIAVIYAVGDIVAGDGGEEQIGADKLARVIREARLDEDVKAIVLRINSPGGLALASDIIWREVELANKVKPLVASMGDVAASGGYYIACGARKILAQPNTITGSIGIFGLLPNCKKLFDDKLGITFDGVKTNQFADMGSVVRSLTHEEQIILQHEVERGYRTFISKVAKSRHVSIEQIDRVAQGRVWTGIDAKKIGLVDSLGGLDDAIHLASKMAKVSNYTIDELPEQRNLFSSIVSEFMTKAHIHLLGIKLDEEISSYQNLINMNRYWGIQTRLMEIPEVR